MKISYRTHPVLKLVESGSLDGLAGRPEDYEAFIQMKHVLQTTWNTTCDLYASNIQSITKPFSEALAASASKMLDDSLVNNLYEKERSGVLIKGAESICYWINPSKDGGHTQTYFRFIETTLGLLKLEAFIYLNVDKHYKGKASTWFASDTKQNRSANDLVQLENTLLVATLNFIQYAPIEVKEVGAGKRVKDVDCKYVNETKSNIQILNSNWFTTLVKSDAFKVRGHFRLQPYGPGLKERKLIWINEFEKQGYVRNFQRPLDI